METNTDTNQTEDIAADILNEDTGPEEPRVYEVGLLLLPTIRDNSIDAETDAIKKKLAEFGGLPIAEGRPQFMDLAYPMFKVIDNKKTQFSQAYFGWIKFDVAQEKVASFQEYLEAHPSILRFILIKTVRENTMAPKKFSGKGKPMRRKTATDTATNESTEAPQEVDEVELDKQLDELVATESVDKTAQAES